MKDIIIVGAVILALIASISIFEIAITMFKVANAMDEITTSLKHTDYSMSERCRELDLSLIKVGSAVTDLYDSMFDNANVTIIRNDKQCEQHEC